MKRSTIRNSLLTAVSALLLILGWKIVSAIVGAAIIVPSPEETALRFLRLMGSPSFWRAVGATVIRGVAGFLISLAAGTLVGIGAGLSPFLGSVLKPLLTVIKATPVISIILIAMIWFHTDAVPVFVTILMTFPIVCSNTTGGILNVDRSLIQMARSYRVSRRSLLTGIYLPSIVPYMVSGVSAAVGITWKVVIAAEVLAMPIYSVGTKMQNARINLETAEVFAWTFVSIVLSGLSERGDEGIARRMRRYERD